MSRSAPEPPALADLPGAARRSVIATAAAALGALADEDLPPPLRRVRAFAPAQRARSGAGLLAAAVESNARFRQQVAQAWRDAHGALADGIDARIDAPAGLDPSDPPDGLLAGLFLLRPDGWAESAGRLLAAIEARDADRRSATDTAGARAEAQSWRRRAERSQQAAEAAGRELAAVQEEVVVLRRELRRARSDADRARAAARLAQQETADQATRAEALRLEAAAALERAELMAREASEASELARRAARAGRAMADTRVRLLLDTVVEATTGLRRELALPPLGSTPAELVDEAGPPGPAGSRARGLEADDPAMLNELVLLPRAHLVVDGYNVTKTGYPALPLDAQRRRLVDGLVALKARTSCEVTCCFDGAQVEGSARAVDRGVRVLFSEPGSSADHLIGRLVRSEPTGRVVVVVTSDQEVVRSVLAAGARAAPSTALVRLLGRS